MSLKAVCLLALGAAVVLGHATPASAGVNHARCIIGLGVDDNYASKNNTAHATRNQGSKYATHKKITALDSTPADLTP